MYRISKRNNIKMYLESTKNKKDFFIIDFNSDDKYMFRHNFTDILDPKLF